VQPTAAPEEAAARDEVVVPQPAAESAGVGLQQEAAVRDVAAVVPRRAVEPASVAERPRGAQVAASDAGEAPRRGAEVLDAAVVPRRAGPGEPGARLLAAAWAGLPSIRRRADRPAPSARAQSALARGRLRTAQP
jgi:hypothetical protein